MSSIKDFINEYRLFPRIFLVVFGWVSYDSIQWFMELKDPSNSQAAFIASMVGILSLILKNYSVSGVKLQQQEREKK